ncbi:hypothetical protein JRO89_XS03G0205500 [Xanthoceras sorbifolium]|uniref:Ribosomal L18p/L5e family protein n=1 Tax=Xanthoceras sorbifolium TaxID=99658 RepID=A0ABQ8IAV2_9ROSI|nr:hypothetical protein JRO89_XS03G0205500 [Xanthoceras sorbifolium]
MTHALLRRSIALKSSVVNCSLLSRVSSFCSRASTNSDRESERQTASTSYSNWIHLSSSFLGDERPHFDGYNIELVDDDTWQVSAGLAQAWRGLEGETQAKSSAHVDDDHSSSFERDPDFDEIDNMRIRGDLFYKLDRGSKEFEEYSFDFHKRKSSKTKDGDRESEKKQASKGKSFGGEKLNKVMMSGSVSNTETSFADKKRVRTPTFNQLTAPYHEPFCLDIFISNASVRACIVHRVTSKVVAVAHSISKDLKFDLGSTRNANACAAVGSILAQRALGDDIHDVLYTPRKGEKLEGKLQIVLQAIIDNGVNVKVKLKQRKAKKITYPAAAPF